MVIVVTRYHGGGVFLKSSEKFLKFAEKFVILSIFMMKGPEIWFVK